MDDHSHDAMILAVVFAIVALYFLVGFVGFQMMDLNDRIKTLEVTAQELVVEPD